MNTQSAIAKTVIGTLVIFVMMLLPGIGWGQIAAWDFTGNNTATATFTATTFNPNLVAASGANNITRGAGAAASAANNSFRTAGFQNNGISTANTDYFQITLTAATGYKISLSTIDAKFAGTASFCVSPGVDNQFAYSLDGTTFSLIGSPQALIGTPATLTQISLSGISALQNVAAGTTITLRYYASGRTTTGGWGFNSPSLGANGLAIGGTVVSGASASSDIIANTSFTYPTNIAYSSFQGTTLTTGNSIEVGQFDIRDGGSAMNDADALTTKLTALTLAVANPGGIRRIALFDGPANVGEVAGGASAAFTGLTTLIAADNSSKTFSVRVSFLSTVTDNQQFSFTVNSATADPAGSTFAAANAGGAVTSVTGDNNRIEVTATDIIFDQGVSSVGMGAVMNPSPTLRAIDANVNYDLDYGSGYSVSITAGTITFDPGATTTGSFSSGLATLNNLKFNTAGTGNKITVTSGSFTDESGAFDVTNPLPEINVKQNVTSIATGGTYDFSTHLSGSSSSAVTFTLENLGSATLNLTGSPIIVKSGTNVSEFTVDQTATASTVGVGSTTTFTVTFIPTSQGGKTAQISIANDDATGSENPYIVNLTGTGTVNTASDIANTAGYSYTSNIAYASYQTATTLTAANSAGVTGLTLRDGAGTTDADDLGTTLTAISFSTGGSVAIRTAALFDGTTNVGEVAVNGATTIAFGGLNIAAADGGAKDFELRVTFQSTVTDNQQITYTVTAATAAATGSGFASANAGGAVSSTAGDDNRIEVIASTLRFVQQPGNTIVNSIMTPAVTIEAIDINNNRDLDQTGTVSLASSGTMTGPVTAVLTTGFGTFGNVVHTVSGTGLTVTASLSGLSNAVSNTFNIIPAPVVFWNPSGLASYGPTPWSATASDSKLTVGGLTRGPGVGTSGTAAGNAWGGTMNTANVATSASAITAGQFVTFSITPNSSYSLSLTTFDLWYRRSGTGPASGLLQYAIGLGSYNDISTISFTNATATGAAITQINLSGISGLQNILSQNVVNFRIVLYGNGAVNGTWYVYNAGLAIGGNIHIVSSTFTGTGNWNTTGNWSNGIPASTIDAIIDGDATINVVAESKNLTINTGKSVTISATKSLTVNGALTNSAGNTGLVVNSGGSLIHSSAGVTATVEREIPAWGVPTVAHGWHMLSSPVAAQAIDPAFTSITAANYDFYAWWEPTSGWVNYKNMTISPTWGEANGGLNFNPGTGYFVEYAATGTKQFKGTLNKDDIGLSNFAISGGSYSGWHLLGNPFTSALIWGTGWSLNHINATAKIWEESSASYVDISTGGKIPALNGFMVQVETGFGGSNSLTIPTSARTHDATAWYKSSDYPHIVLVANDPSGQTAQQTVIRFDEAATTGFDAAFDSHFLPGYAPLFYSVAGGENLSTNSLPEAGGTVQIPVSFVKNDGSNFTINAKTISGLYGPVILNDLKTNISQDLTLNPDYSFTSTAGDDPNRFLVTFHSVGINEAPTGKTFSIYTSGNNLYVTDITGKNQGIVYIYNLMGQLLSQQNIGGNVTRITLNAPAGYYLVKVVTSEQAYTTKVFIK